MIFKKYLTTTRQQRHEEREAELYRSLMRREAKIGGEIFGPVTPGNRREFFCLDEHTWIWHEEWQDAEGSINICTTRYDIRPTGVLKAQDGQSYQRVKLEEAKRLLEAIRTYEYRMRTELYSAYLKVYFSLKIINMMHHYFDYAAATPMSPDVLEAMRPYFTEKFHNPSALYLASQGIKDDATRARRSVAETLGAKPSEIIFTAGGTESDNLAIRGIMDYFPEANCIVSAIEHDAVLEPAKLYRHKLAPVRQDGRLDVPALNELIDDETVLISVMYANNEIGTIQPLHDITRLVNGIRQSRARSGNTRPLYVHTDACQAANTQSLLVNSLGVDLMTLNGGKIYGPKQSGILFIKTGTLLRPQIVGGGQERGLRSGTENVPSAIGFAAALSAAQQNRDTEEKRLRNLQHDFIKRLQAKIPHAIINGSVQYRLPGNVHITLPGTDNETLMMQLDEAGFQVATGSACSASSDDPSHVLTAIGLSDEYARSSLRITFGRGTDTAAIEALSESLVTLV